MRVDTVPHYLQISPRIRLSDRNLIRCRAKAAQITEKNIKTGSKRSLSPTAAPSPLLGPETNQNISSPLSSIRSFFLPRGFPGSVTQDYLLYQIYTFPSHVTGWMSHSLAGSSMLKALGVGTSAAGAVGFSAAIKWVTKDGVGAIGRLFVGGRLSAVFDEDPKRWRMIAEAVTSVGLALEIATQLSPNNFITLAGAGTLAKATGKGMGRPCFRVIQTHFASQNNVGDVSAKEEVWEVTAQLIGLASSVALLSALEVGGTPEAVIPLWAGIHGLHVALRYFALTQLRFPYPNMKRGVALVTQHVGSGSVPTIDEANSEENILFEPENALKCNFGCSATELGVAAIDELIALYENEQYVLTWRDGAAYVGLFESSTTRDMLRALWQSAYLSSKLSGSGNIKEAGIEELKESLMEMQLQFPDFEMKAAKVGWELHRGVFPVGNYQLMLGG